MLLSVLRLVVRLPPRPRVAILMILFLTAMLLPILGSLSFGYEELLNYLGKDATLTGRVLLWEYAMNSIAEQPVFGVGYQAFWQQGNTGAEQLWFYSYIPNRTGYHFHNTFLQIGVDLGLVGLLVFLGIFGVAMTRIVVGLCNARPAAEHMFAITIFIFFLLRLPIEVDLFFQFQIASVLICMAWVYLRQFARLGSDRGKLARRSVQD
jgi:exopolysaccharide production protein ExoQ